MIKIIYGIYKMNNNENGYNNNMNENSYNNNGNENENYENINRANIAFSFVRPE